MSRKINYEALKAAIIEKVKGGFEFHDYSPYSLAEINPENGDIRLWAKNPDLLRYWDYTMKGNAPSTIIYAVAKLLDINVEDYLEVTHTYKSRVLQWLESPDFLDNIGLYKRVSANGELFYEFDLGAKYYPLLADSYGVNWWKKLYYVIGLDTIEGYEV